MKRTKRILLFSLSVTLTFSVVTLLSIPMTRADDNEATSVVSIDETSFPDPVFRSKVIEYDTDGNSEFSQEELDAIITFECSDSEITDLTGIEYFTSLEELDCSYNEITDLNLKSNTKLKNLECNTNALTSLDLSFNKALVSVNCDNNKLTSVTLDNPSLVSFSAYMNQLASIDVSKCPNLVFLNLEVNQIESLDVSKNTSLTMLFVEGNKLDALNIRNNTALEVFGCGYNQITSLDVSQNTSLESLYCEGNKLKDLDISKNTGLRKLYCFGMALKEMDISNCPSLIEVYTTGEIDYGGGKNIIYFLDDEKICLNIDSDVPIFTEPKPETPSNAKAAPVSDSSINVSWNQVEGVDGYQVARATSASGTFTTLGSVTTTNRFCTGLTAGRTYYFKVRAYKEVNGTKRYGAYSSVVSATTIKVNVPSGVKADPATASSVKVSWKQVEGADGYQVARATSAGGTYTTLGTVTTTNRVCAGLTAGKTYYFKVRAYKEVNGTKIYSSYSSAVSAAPIKVSAPSGVKAVSSSVTSVKVSWNAVSGADGYQVARATSSNGTFTTLGSVTTTNRVCAGLTCGSTYYFKVRAYKEVNGTKIYGAYSSIVSAVPKPAAPTGVKATSSSATSVTVSWSKVTGATGYEVFRATSKDGTYSKLGTVTGTSRNCPGLTAGKIYYFKVRAYKVVNGTKIYGAYSTIVSEVPK